MSEDEFTATLRRLRRRLRVQAHLFEDPESYVDGVEDALELVERAMSNKHAEGDGTASDDGRERTAS